MQLVLDGVILPLKTQVSSLGVFLDSSLSLDAQILAVARSAFAQLKLVCQLCLFLERSDLVIVIHALVASQLYVGLPLEGVRKLQQI